MARSPDLRLRQRWRQLLDLFDGEQTTVAAFCRKHRVSPASFYLWRRKLHAPAPARSPNALAPSFVPVQVQGRAPDVDPLVRVHLPGGVRVEIPATERELALAAISALAAADERPEAQR